jgi:hypothetical protein
MVSSCAVGELICSLIAKAADLSNFRLRERSFPPGSQVGYQALRPSRRPPARDAEKDRPLVRGAARRAHVLDGEAPRRSS